MLHGGPGGSCGPTMRRFHDPKRYFIILHDQRGAGRSRPSAELVDNNTQALVSDIEQLRLALRLKRVQLFGGSWGSTLALAYAQKYPQHVSSLVLRGVFTATREEIDHFYHGGAGQFFPEVHERLRAVVPRPDSKDYPAQLLALLTGKDHDTRQKVARAWAAYETKLAALATSDEEVGAIVDAEDCYSFSLIENHYMANACFLNEGQLLADASKLSGIPTVICHGRYDVICPPMTAWRLMKAVGGARLVIVEAAGHSGSAPPMRSALIEAVKSIQPLIAETANMRLPLAPTSRPTTAPSESNPSRER
jgi:proline iminopeptidase